MSSRNKCAACGRGGQRQCLALGGLICPECCGSKRGSALPCPPACPFFPFGTAAYDAWLRIDGSWQTKSLNYVARRLGSAPLKTLMDEFTLEGGDPQHGLEDAVGGAVYAALFLRRDAAGKTLADHWEADGWRGLDNDERVMMRHRRHTRPTVIEVQRVLDGQALECLDLFDPDPKPFIVFDRSSARRAVRFVRLLTWLTHYPHFSRIGCGGVELPETISAAFVEEIRARTVEAAVQRPGLTEKDYLVEHFVEACRLSFEMAEEWTQQMLRGLDLHQCRGTYRIVGDRGEVEAILRGKPDFRWEEEQPRDGDPVGTLYFDWLRRGESKKLERRMPAPFRHGDEDVDGVGTLGEVRLFADKLVVETVSKQKFDFAKKIVRRYFGDLLRPEAESIVDLAKQMAERRADCDLLEPPPETKPAKAPSSVPPEVERQVLEDFYGRTYRKFLDEKIPALGGMTPRTAARNPAMRPPLIAVMKTHLHGLDQLKRDKGIVIDIGWVLDELGLQELK